MTLYNPFCYCSVFSFDKCRIVGIFCNLPRLDTFACYVVINVKLVYKKIFFFLIDVGFTHVH